MSLRLTCHYPSGATVITVAGDVDATTSTDLASYIEQTRRQPGDHLVLDLSGMPFLDSAGLSVLLTAHTFTREHGGTVHLADLQPAPARMLHITGIDTHIPVHATVTDALAALDVT
ncbi:STAS domain-containing protein [Nonomuraea mangrovi]|uniref:Anti-sigma factor antagonist n=1 Tax=Nonomuraea mangrovi TaxID=2316207 RepID=A0ABW4TB03_9ACTN